MPSHLTPRAALGAAIVTAITLVGCNDTQPTAPAAPGAPAGALTATTFTGVTVSPSTVYQTMTGWEASDWAGQDDPTFLAWKDRLLDLAVNDLGINRVRLQVRAGLENSTDYWSLYRAGKISGTTWSCARYATVNDDASATTTNAAGFKWAELDYKIDNIITPMRQKLAARGERLYVNLNFVDFTRTQCAGFSYNLHASPAEYAEFALAAFAHIRTKYGWAPDALEAILEPDNGTPFNDATLLGKAIVAAGNRLKAAGFAPAIIAPSTKATDAAPVFFDKLIAVPGASAFVREISYHRYSGYSDAALQAIAARAKQYGIRSAMLEKIGATDDDLLKDLTLANNSAWQQYTIGGPGATDDGSRYYLVDTSTGQITLSSRATYLRQYFRFVRYGAQRVGTTSGKTNVIPIAFRNANGKFVVVADDGAGPFSIAGLPAGTYGQMYTTPTQAGVPVADQTVAAGQLVRVAAPAGSLVTVWQK